MWGALIAAYIFEDGKPPLVFETIEVPANIEELRKQFNELHPNADSLEGDEKDTYEELEEFFEDLSTKVNRPKGRNPNYKKSDIK